MLMSGDYALTYDKKHNYINIFLPQTAETTITTNGAVSVRRTDVTEPELMVLLQIVKIMFEKGVT